MTETWETEGVSEISYNPETYKVIFQSTKAKPHAVIQVDSCSTPDFIYKFELKRGEHHKANEMFKVIFYE